MKIKILPHRILANTESEDNLFDLPLIEAVYAIRKLKVAVHYGNSIVEVDEPNRHGQVFIEEFDIWININEYEDQHK